MTAGTSFQGRVNVNAVPKSNHVTIIFLGGDPEHLFSHFSDSLCAYVGKANTVLCNAHNVNAALEVFDKTALNFTASIAVANPDGSIDVSLFKNLEIFRQLLKQNFLTWLIGHELGHAVLHSRNADRETQALHFDLVFDKREQEADLFVIKAIESDPVLRAAFPVMLLEYIEQKFREMYRSQHYVEPSIVPARGGAVKTVTVNPDQLYMRLFIRAVRIMDESLQRNPKALEEATYAVINGQLAYVGSYKFPPYYKFIKSRVVFDERSLYLRQLLRSWHNLVGAWRADKPINQPGGKNED